MEKKWVMKIQSHFIRLHKIIFPIMIIYFFLERFILDEPVGIMPAIFLLLSLLIEAILLFSKKDWQIVFLIWRYVEGMLSCFFMFHAENEFRYGLFWLLLFLFTMEYFLCFDFLEGYFRTICILTITIPFFAFILIQNIVEKTMAETLLSDLCIGLIYVIIIAFAGELITHGINILEKKMFAQSRLIESINEKNEALKVNQEKVKRANELLGVQKIELESANKRIANANAQMQIQNQIMKYISASLEIEKLMNIITESVEREIGVDVCAITLLPGTVENRNILYKVKTHLNQEFEDSLGESIQKRCFEPYVENGFIFYDNHVDGKKYSFLNANFMGSLMIMPLMQEGERIGAFFVGCPDCDFFTENNKQFFENIVSQLLIAITNANMYMKMKSMAIKDGLTNIYNRRHLTKMFNECMNEAILVKQPLSVALFDIDKFKNVNDQYGHLFGDIVIKTVASLADQFAQDCGGFAGRYGGEEFVIVFPNKTLEEAYKTVEIIHRSVRETQLEHNGEIVHITVSAGITSYPKTCHNPGELLNRADWAMYYSKEHGRNQITIDSDEVRKEVMIK